MSDFKSKIHPNRFRLGLCMQSAPGPVGGAYSAVADRTDP